MGVAGTESESNWFSTRETPDQTLTQTPNHPALDVPFITNSITDPITYSDIQSTSTRITLKYRRRRHDGNHKGTVTRGLKFGSGRVWEHGCCAWFGLELLRVSARMCEWRAVAKKNFVTLKPEVKLETDCNVFSDRSAIQSFNGFN